MSERCACGHLNETCDRPASPDHKVPHTAVWDEAANQYRCGTCRATIVRTTPPDYWKHEPPLAPQPDTASRELREAAQAFVDVWGDTDAMESSATFVRLRAALAHSPTRRDARTPGRARRRVRT